MPVPRLLEDLFRLLLPPASREYVLGDLHEKCKSPTRYLRTALSVLGPVIISRIRRTTDFQVFLMEVFAVYLSFSAAAWWFGERAFLYDEAGFIRLAIPTGVTMAGLLLCNAYADPEQPPSVTRPLRQSGGSVALALFGQLVLFNFAYSIAVPLNVLLYGSCTSVVLVAMLRMLFPPVFTRSVKIVVAPQTRLAQKAWLTPSRVPLQRIRHIVGDASRASNIRTAMWWGAALLMAAVLLPAMWHEAAWKIRFAIVTIAVLLALYQSSRQAP